MKKRYSVSLSGEVRGAGVDPLVGALPHTPSVLHCSSNRYSRYLE
jgi:hypothetical protein